jgi:hypothetical protein
VTNKKYRTKKLLLLVFPFSFLLLLVLVLVLLLLLYPISSPSLYPSLCLLLTYLLRTKQPRRPLTSPPTMAPQFGAVLLGRGPPAQPAIAQQTCWSWLLEAKILDYHLSYVRLLGKELSKSKSTKVIDSHRRPNPRGVLGRTIAITSFVPGTSVQR